MKAINFLRVAILLIGILLNACAPTAISSAPANVGGGKPLSEVIFTGVIEGMNGDQWVINGQTIQVDSSVLRDGPFTVGDTVKVEASVAGDGSVVAQRVETPAAADLVETGTSTPDASASTPDASSPTQAPGFDNNGNEAVGTVNTITDTSITIDGQTYTLASNVEIKGQIVPGASVKLHFTLNADGSLSVTEITLADPTQVGNGNSNDDNSNGSGANEDNSNSNSNDDHSNDNNPNDDHGNDDDHDDGDSSGSHNN